MRSFVWGLMLPHLAVAAGGRERERVSKVHKDASLPLSLCSFGGLTRKLSRGRREWGNLFETKPLRPTHLSPFGLGIGLSQAKIIYY